jgi:hypothetical protein
MTGLTEIVGQHTGRARTVLRYAHTTGELVAEAKRPGFTAQSWAPLAALVSVVGDFHSVVNSLSVYEFADDDRIRRLDLYLQMALPG